MASNKNSAMSNANSPQPAVPAPTKVSIPILVATQVAVAVVNNPQVEDVSHETILKIEQKTRETYKISEELYKATKVQELQKFGTPMEVFKRINEFALRSSDVATSGESCRPDNVFFRAMALMEVGLVGDGDQRVRAANAVRQARIETRAEYDVRKAVKAEEEQKRNGRRNAACSAEQKKGGAKVQTKTGYAKK